MHTLSAPPLSRKSPRIYGCFIVTALSFLLLKSNSRRLNFIFCSYSKLRIACSYFFTKVGAHSRRSIAAPLTGVRLVLQLFSYAVQGVMFFDFYKFRNQDHRLSRWFALPLEGAITSCACKRIESPPSALLSQLPPLAAIFICSLLLFHP